MKRDESAFSSKILHRHRCLPLNNYTVIVLFSSVVCFSKSRSAMLIARVNTWVPLLAHSTHHHIINQVTPTVRAKSVGAK